MADRPKDSFKNAGRASFGLLLGFRGGIDHLRQSSLSGIRDIRDKKTVYPALYLRKEEVTRLHLKRLGVKQKTDDGIIVLPYDVIHVGFMLKAA